MVCLIIILCSRIGISTIAGGVAGVIGLTGIYGFLAYLFTYGLIVGLLSLKMKNQTTQYFFSASALFWDGLSQGLLVSSSFDPR